MWFSCGFTSTNPTAGAARANPGTAIVWVDFDGYETTTFGDLILTSVVKHVGQSVYDTIQSELDGTFTSEAYIGNLENGGVGLAPFHAFQDKVPAELSQKLEALKADVIAGTIKIETVNQP